MGKNITTRFTPDGKLEIVYDDILGEYIVIPLENGKRKHPSLWTYSNSPARVAEIVRDYESSTVEK